MTVPAPLARAVDALAEATVVGSFTSLGYRLRAATEGWTPLSELDLRDRVLVVTGGNSGLGFEIASWGARLGARVELVARNPDRGAAAVEAIARRAAGARVTLRLADMSDLASVRRLADDLVDGHDHLDVLIHNAGAIVDPRAESAQGIESTLATMVVGPHALTTSLSERGRLDGSRVIWMTSGGAYTTGLHLDDLQFEDGYSGVNAYARAKRAQIDMVAEWSALHPDISSYAVHPGWTDTPGVKESLPTFHRVLGPLLRTPSEGVDTAVWLAATEPAPPAGGLWFDRRERGVARLPRTATSPDDRTRLWAAIEGLAAR